jgi:predicted nucleic acid-binding protein
MTKPILCADANICVKLVIQEHDSSLAVELWRRWESQRALVIAPTLWGYEMTSITRKLVYRGLLAPELEKVTLDEIFRIPVRQVRPANLHRRAWALAQRFNRPAAYDFHYLALAEMSKCAFWTADERLYNAVRHELSWVHWLGNLSSGE